MNVIRQDYCNILFDLLGSKESSFADPEIGQSLNNLKSDQVTDSLNQMGSYSTENTVVNSYLYAQKHKVIADN